MLKKELKQFLNKEKRCCDFMMLSRPIRKVKRSAKLAFMFFVFTSIAYIPLALYLCPCKLTYEDLILFYFSMEQYDLLYYHWRSL